MSQKGMSPLIGAILLIATAMLIAIMLYQWQLNYIDSYSKDLEGSVKNTLRCEKADFSIEKITFDCHGNCDKATLITKLHNYGDVSLKIEKIYVRNKESKVFEYPGGLLEVGEVKEFINTSTACNELNKNIEEVLVITNCPNIGDSSENVEFVNCPA